MKSIELTVCSLLRRPSALAAALLFAVSAAHAADYPTTILGDNPVAYYRFEETNDDTTALDSTTNLLDGTYNFVNSQPEQGLAGIDSNSIAFVGGTTTAYGTVSLPFSTLLSPVAGDGVHGAPFTVECWADCYTDNNGGPYLSLCGMHGTYGGAPYGNASGWLFGATPGPGSQWAFVLRNGNFLTGGTVTPLQWAYLVGIYDGTNGYLYVNGTLVSSGPSAGYLADNGADGVVGAVPNAGLEPSGPYGVWDGGIDELAFYTNALTLSQITNHYAVGLASFRVASTPPAILTQPTDETNYSGTDVTFTLVSSGTAPLSYQWYREAAGITNYSGQAISGATNAHYTFVDNFAADNGAEFYAVITNSIGATNSLIVALTVETNLNIIGPPLSITRNVGSHAAFRVAAGGAVPFGYQWSVSTNNGSTFATLPGQTADTLWLTNVQLGWNGNIYAVIVTNPFTTSSNAAVLSVQSRATNIALNAYETIVAADQPVALYVLNESSNGTTATDAVGTFDGSYNNASGMIVWDIPVGIPNDSDTGVDLQDNQTATAGLGGVVDIPYYLELNPFGPWSAEAWIRPDSVDGQFRVPFSSMNNTNIGNQVYGWLLYEYGSIPSYWTFVIYNGSASGNFETDFGDAFSTPGTWNHFVFTDDGTNIVFYVNGAAAVQTTVAATGYAPQGINGDPGLAGTDEVLGQRSDNAFFGGNAGMADVAFYNYALSPTQIQSHFLNKAQFSYSLSNGHIILTWPLGTLLGTTNLAKPFLPVNAATSPYTVPTGSAQFFYKVVVQ